MQINVKEWPCIVRQWRSVERQRVKTAARKEILSMQIRRAANLARFRDEVPADIRHLAPPECGNDDFRATCSRWWHWRKRLEGLQRDASIQAGIANKTARAVSKKVVRGIFFAWKLELADR